MIAWHIQLELRGFHHAFGALTFEDAYKIAVHEYEVFIKDVGPLATIYVTPSPPAVRYNLRRHGQATVWEIAEGASEEEDGVVSSCLIAPAPAPPMMPATGTPRT